MATHGDMSNELLSLWLKAGSGLSCEEARELIQRLSDAEIDHATDLEAQTTKAADELAEAQESRAEEVAAAKEEGAEEVKSAIRRILEDAPARHILEWLDDLAEGRPQGTGHQLPVKNAEQRVAKDVLRLAKQGGKPALDQIKLLANRLLE
jgi:hypothetical protein